MLLDRIQPVVFQMGQQTSPFKRVYASPNAIYVRPSAIAHVLGVCKHFTSIPFWCGLSGVCETDSLSHLKGPVYSFLRCAESQ